MMLIQSGRFGGAGWLISSTLNPTTDSPGWSGYTNRQIIDQSVLSNIGGSLLRVTFLASPSAGFILGNAYVGHAAASGDAYDFESAPTQLLFSGIAGVTAGTGASIVSDSVSFSIQSSKNLIIAMYFSGTSSLAHKVSATTGFSTYYKNANDAATENATGYTVGVSQEGISLVESFF